MVDFAIGFLLWGFELQLRIDNVEVCLFFWYLLRWWFWRIGIVFGLFCAGLWWEEIQSIFNVLLHGLEKVSLEMRFECKTLRSIEFQMEFCDARDLLIEFLTVLVVPFYFAWNLFKLFCVARRTFKRLFFTFWWLYEILLKYFFKMKFDITEKK